MRCESYNANKFNIMFPVCSLLVISESPLNFLLQQDRIKTCNSKPNSFFKKLFQGYWRCLAFLKKKVGSCQNHPTRPETGKIEKPIKTERFEGNEGNMGEIRGNMKG